MPNQTGMYEVVQAALKGIRTAQAEYEEWSGGDWLVRAPEYFLTVAIAREIAKLPGKKFVTLECGTKIALDSAEAVGQGRLSDKIRVGGRFDIMLWRYNDETPRAPIEVKSQIKDINGIKEDLDRIRKVIQRKPDTSTFKFGLSCFYLAADDKKDFSAGEIIEKRISKIFEDAQDLIGNECTAEFFRTKLTVEGISAWAGAVILIKRKGKTNIA